jgi:putative aldouronate transport system permease protein
MVRAKTFAARFSYGIVTTLVVLMTLVSLAPIINTLALSFSSQDFALAGKVSFWPRGLTFDAYRRILNDSAFFTALFISVKRVIIGGGLNLILIILMAFPLSREKKDFKSRDIYMWIIIFTMLFSGGLIPWYMTINAYGLIDSFWALVLPGAVPIFYVVLLMNFFRGVPKELEEAAILDGAGPWYVMLKIFVPISMPAIATVTLFSVIGQWNSFFDGLILMNTSSHYPLQTYIQQLIFQFNPDNLANMTPQQIAELMKVSGKTFNAAKIFVSMIPILVLYPRLQKYFISGIVLGTTKEKAQEIISN